MHFLFILEASGLLDVHFTIVKCKNPKIDVFCFFFLQTFNMAKIELSCRRELNLKILSTHCFAFFAEGENVISGLSCRRELDFDVFVRQRKKAGSVSEMPIFGGCLG